MKDGISLYPARLDWLNSLNLYGIKLGLDNITALLRRMGDPQNAYPCIHVAGSDGKGSTCAAIAAVLRAKGLRVGLYTSPHIMDFRERIQVDGSPISEGELSHQIGCLRHFVDDMRESGMVCTFFEATTAAAFSYFKDRDVDVAVVEVGMGGRFDATNVITPLVSVISNISLEHTQYLGDTIGKIAFEKAGIIKDGVPAVTINTGPALEVIAAVAEERGSPLTRVDPEGIEVLESLPGGVRFSFRGREHFISVPGRNEAKDAALAIASLEAMGDSFGDLSAAVDEGLSEVRWPCRLEPMDGDIIVDVTHTLAGAEGLAADVAEIYGKAVLVFGILSDKDSPDICRSLARIASKVVVTAPSCGRAKPAEETLEVMKGYFPDAVMSPTVGGAMEAALKIRSPEEKILVTGSFYMAEEALRWMGRTSL